IQREGNHLSASGHVGNDEALPTRIRTDQCNGSQAHEDVEGRAWRSYWPVAGRNDALSDRIQKVLNKSAIRDLWYAVVIERLIDGNDATITLQRCTQSRATGGASCGSRSSRWQRK